MAQVTINLYSFSELNKDAQAKAILEYTQFMETNRHEWEQDDEFTTEYVQEHIEINEYLFFRDGELAHCTTYTGKHPKSGATEFHFHGTTYDITKQPT